jgi:dUTP pyrophosphatase
MKLRIAPSGGVAVPPPRYQTAGAAGLDLCAAIEEPITLAPGKRRLIPTGWAIALPEGYEAQVRPRSGLALKHGVTVLNAPGTIDSDFRGSVGVVLINHGEEAFEVKPGDRIAQLVVARHERVELEIREALDDTERGSGGYGSTG